MDAYPGDTDVRLRLRTGVVLAVTVGAYVGYLAASVLVLLRLDLTGTLTPPHVVNTVVWASGFLGLPAVGAILAIKRPSNPVGWAILAAGAGVYLTLVAGELAEYQVARTGSVEGLSAVVAAVANGVWPVVVVAIVHIVLLFPDGELERTGRILSRAAVGVGFALVPLRLFRPGRLDLEVEVTNPLALSWVPGGDVLVAPLTTGLLVIALIGLGRLVVRYRGADEIHRKQFQWVLWSLAALPALVLLGNGIEELTDAYWTGQVLAVLGFDVGFLGFAFAIGRAILKHDLYGIDRIVSRAFAYVGVTAVLATVYVAGVLGVGALVPGGSSDLLVAASTLAVAAAFQPVRTRVQLVVDRRFNRARYDAEQEVAALADRLRREVELDSMAEELAGTVDRVVRPASVSLLLVAPAQRP